MLILYSYEMLTTVSQLRCCLLLFGPSIQLIQTAAGIKLNGLFLFRGAIEGPVEMSSPV